MSDKSNTPNTAISADELTSVSQSPLGKALAAAYANAKTFSGDAAALAKAAAGIMKGTR